MQALSLACAANLLCCQASLKDFVTGFAKRKQQRREYGAIQAAKKQRIARNAARKEVRQAQSPGGRYTRCCMLTNQLSLLSRFCLLFVCGSLLQRRDAMKLQDRVTGAFGDKHSDDSDDETGEATQGLIMGSHTHAEERRACSRLAGSRTGSQC